MSWSTDKVGGASGVTMAERTHEGGCRRSGGGFSIPLRNYELLIAARLPQQFAIASAHQSKTALHETNGPISQIGGLPGPVGDACSAKRPLCDHTIAVAFDAAIERVQHRRQSLSPLWGQFLKCRTGGPAIERPPETTRGVRANLEITIEH
jgi:hypothetical protein